MFWSESQVDTHQYIEIKETLRMFHSETSSFDEVANLFDKVNDFEKVICVQFLP